VEAPLQSDALDISGVNPNHALSVNQNLGEEGHTGIKRYPSNPVSQGSATARHTELLVSALRIIYNSFLESELGPFLSGTVNVNLYELN